MSQRTAVEKQPTGIAGFDFISNGGFPKARTTLVAGTAGSAKTVFAVQFLAEGILQYGERGVFITFEESADDIRANMIGFGWDIARWEAEGSWAFVDASPQPGEESIVVGAYDLGALLARIEHAIQRVEAARVSMDSLGAIFSRFNRDSLIRSELLRIAVGLKHMGVTALMTCERNADYGDISRHGIEEFVTDNVVILRNALEDEKRRRTIEILKFRGTSHQKGEFPLTVVSHAGIVVVPISSVVLALPSSSERITSGNAQLDEMCGSGLFRNAVALVSGATGTGKTLLTTEFLHGGLSRGERCLLFAFEESQEQICRNARGWGIDLKPYLDDKRLAMVCEYPEVASLEDHLVSMKETIATVKPDRVALDSLTALARVATLKGFRDFIIGLTAFIKTQGATGFFTVTTPALFHTSSVTEAHFSTMTDTIVMLRYVELYGAVSRGITVLKMRGSQHSKEIREFEISEAGMRIGEPVQAMTGVMTGTPVVRETGHLHDMPSRARYIVDILTQMGTSTLDQLQLETGLTLDGLEQEMHLLQQQGMVLALRRNDTLHYRATM